MAFARKVSISCQHPLETPAVAERLRKMSESLLTLT